MEFSFIIPIYKVERFLDECIESIVRQTYKKFEIILVDDGSPDDCPQICDNWAKRDNRISVIHKMNGGLSDARNAGLKLAKGEYVIFVDSDDYWAKVDSLEVFADALEQNNKIDVLFFNVFYLDNNTGDKTYWPSYSKVLPKVCTSLDAIKLMLQSGSVSMSAWCKVVKRSLLLDNKLFFQSGFYGEDIPWFVSLMQFAKTIAFSNEYVYAYRQNVSTSITNSNRPKHVRDMRYIIESECEKMLKRQISQEWKNCMNSFLAFNYSILLSQFDYVSGYERRDLWKFMRKYAFLLKYIDHLKVRKVNKVYKLLGLKPTAWVLRYYLHHK